jgi:hypothetical protein
VKLTIRRDSLGLARADLNTAPIEYGRAMIQMVLPNAAPASAQAVGTLIN